MAMEGAAISALTHAVSLEPDALQRDHPPDERALHRDVPRRGVAVDPSALLERDVVVRGQDFALDRAAYRHGFLRVNRCR